MSNASSAVVRIVITQIIAIIGGLILGAIAHFLFGDWGLAIFVVYISYWVLLLEDQQLQISVPLLF